MIDFPAFVHGVFILFVITLMVGILLFFRKPEIRKVIPKERRAILLLASLGLILVSSMIIVLKIGDWKSEYRGPKNEVQLAQNLNLDEYRFIDQTFQPLGQEYRQLKTRIIALNKIIIKIDKLHKQHKNHRHLLRRMLGVFTQERNLQNVLYKEVNIEIRNAMILASTTQNASSVQDQFYERAKVLHSKVLNTQNRYDKILGQTAGLLADSLKEARRRLYKTAQRQVNKQSSNKSINSTKLLSFSDETAQTLLLHLEQNDPESLILTKQIIQYVITARQNKDKLLAWIQREEELKTPLTKTMQLWSDAEIQGLIFWGNLLYSMEATYLASQFNMPKYNPAYRYLMNDLVKIIPKHLETLAKLHQDVGNSYFPIDISKKK